ncbi:hypothetical protein BU26DRAFT_67653 [Trematosphaeria pertusa]|uniref:C2H2-type domain-containing protein n=1 Tax=Trematosphaeria pertusa TaxID=390896 RepID=A0A6A6I4X4_9PLEO|nr:uncharacterized protein BU26DRAFT_67653 [Trematosphaeria pertusa]KAF2245366.1 hypothetical protein BU26DRAFT_67653 [Trematosphaeria pertusa]
MISDTAPAIREEPNLHPTDVPDTIPLTDLGHEPHLLSPPKISQLDNVGSGHASLSPSFHSSDNLENFSPHSQLWSNSEHSSPYRSSSSATSLNSAGQHPVEKAEACRNSKVEIPRADGPAHRRCRHAAKVEARQANVCMLCGLSFTCAKDLKRHESSAKHRKRLQSPSCPDSSQPQQYACVCGKKYPREDSLLRHFRTSNTSPQDSTHRPIPHS